MSRLCKHFDEWWEAYDYCREANHPVDVIVDVDSERCGDAGVAMRIYPSGSFKRLDSSVGGGVL